MTQIPAQRPETTHVGDGATLAFAIGFDMGPSSILQVWVDGVPRTAGLHYNRAGSNVVFVVAPADGAAIAWRRRTPIRQDREFPNQPTMRPLAVEGALNERAAVDQEVDAVASRAFTAPIGEQGSNVPTAALRRGRAAGWADTPEAPMTAVPSTSAAVASDLLRAEDARDRAETAAFNGGLSAQEAMTAEAVTVAARDQATNAAAQAEAFLNAFPADIIYDSEAAGRAAVADGVHFWVRTADGLQSWRRTNADASVAGPLVPSLGQVTALATPSFYIVLMMTDGGPNNWVLTPTSRLPNNTGLGVTFRFRPPNKSPGDVLARVLGINDADPWYVVGPGGDINADQLQDGTYTSQDELEFERKPGASVWVVKRVLNASLAKVGSAAAGGDPFTAWAGAGAAALAFTGSL